MTLRSKDTTPIQRFDSRSRSRPRGKDRGNHQACPEGTPRCLCRKLAELYETGRLTLYRGTVSQTRLVEQLQLPKGVLVNRHRQKSAPGRCVSRFDRLLESWGHGTVWEEKIPQIRQLLEEHKTAGALPVNEQGDLNRTAILREFGLKDASTHVVQKRAPKLRALLDAYDTTRDDPAYTPYKYDALETRLKRVLTSEELKLTHGRIVSREWIAEKLKVKPGALASTPKLNELIEQKQREIDKQLRRGRTKKAFRIGRTEHINLGATPYSDKHERVFDFSGLVPDYGLEYAEKVGTVFIAVSESLVAPKAHYHRMRHFLGWLANRPSGDITERLRRGEAVGRGEFERAALLYKAELTYEMAKGEATGDGLTRYCRSSRDPAKRGCSPACASQRHRGGDSGKQEHRDRASSRPGRWIPKRARCSRVPGTATSSSAQAGTQSRSVKCWRWNGLRATTCRARCQRRSACCARSAWSNCGGVHRASSRHGERSTRQDAR